MQTQLQLTDAVVEVRQSISRLIVNPPDFSQVMVRLIDLFSTKTLDETAVAAIVEEIFVQVLNYLTLTGLMWSCYLFREYFHYPFSLMGKHVVIG